MTGAIPSSRGALQVSGEVLTVKRVGDYFLLTLVADGIPERTKPGHFVSIAVGGATSNALMRRSFSLYRVRPAGVYGGTIEIVFEAAGTSGRWLSSLQPHTPVDLVGPLGRPFALPKEPVTCALVGGGTGSSPLFALAEKLRERHCGVHMVLGAATEPRLFGTLEAKRSAQSVTVTTEDGSVGIRGIVTDALPPLLARAKVEVVYSCGPHGMLEGVTRLATEHGAWSQTSVQQAMPCGFGACLACVVPVVGEGDVTRWVRSCVEGPVFAGDKVRWEAMGAHPAETLGERTSEASR